jgi:hypothetical protein
MKIDKYIGSVEIHIDTSRIDSNIREAHRKLNEQIVADCEPLVPFRQGALRGSVGYPDGVYGDVIEYNAPHAHYQYIGLVRTDELGRVFVGKGEKKPVLTDRALVYHTPGTTSSWFEVAKAQNLENWRDLVGKEMGKR